MINTTKLHGRIVECGYTISSFADAMDINRQSLSQKIHNKADFKLREIYRACSLLGIPTRDIANYFFCPSVSVKDTEE